MTLLKAVRGTRDLLPPETDLWNRVEATARSVFARYNFGEIRTPIFEDTALFARGVGEETDIVSKEMYTWEDRARAQSEKSQSLTLRPENTAGVVRAYIEHNLGESRPPPEALLHRPAVPPRAPAKRPLPPVLANRRGSHRPAIGRLRIAPPRCRSDRNARQLPRRARHHRLDPRPQLRRLRIGSPPLHRRPPRSSRPRQASDVPRQPAPRRNQSPPRPRLQGSRRRSHHRRPCPKSPTTSTTHRKPTSQRYSRPSTPAACSTKSIPASSAASTTTPAPPSSSAHGGLGAQNALLGGGRYDGLSEMLGGPKAPGIGFAMGLDRLILTLQAQAEAAPRRIRTRARNRRLPRTPRRTAQRAPPSN